MRHTKSHVAFPMVFTTTLCGVRYSPSPFIYSCHNLYACFAAIVLSSKQIILHSNSSYWAFLLYHWQRKHSNCGHTYKVLITCIIQSHHTSAAVYISHFELHQVVARSSAVEENSIQTLDSSTWLFLQYSGTVNLKRGLQPLIWTHGTMNHSTTLSTETNSRFAGLILSARIQAQ